MWNDWHHEVRNAAAQTLGRTGHGKEVHDDLRDRLLEGNERDRIDALHKIAHLGKCVIVGEMFCFCSCSYSVHSSGV